MRKFTSLSLIAVLVVSGFITAPITVSANPAFHDMSKIAEQLAKEQRYDEALQALRSAAPSQQNNFNHRMAKARILTWSRKFPEAKREYQRLIEDFPNNPDIRVSAGYMELIRGDLNQAQRYFETVLRDHPQYLDARHGLTQIQGRRLRDIQRRQATTRNPATQQSTPATYRTLQCPAGYALQPAGFCLRIY